MNLQERRKLSVYLCYLLRHAPESVGLDMDEHGWVYVDQLICQVNESQQFPLTQELLRIIVAEDDKKRFCFSEDGKHIKACQGHSIPWVAPDATPGEPPVYLYHGTTAEALKEIQACGAIKRMARHDVHLHTTEQQAVQVAKRWKNKTPIVLKITAKAMSKDGFAFRVCENGVWLCREIPIHYIYEQLDVTE